TFTWKLDDAVTQVFPTASPELPEEAQPVAGARNDTLQQLTAASTALVPYADAVLALPEAHIEVPQQEPWQIPWRSLGSQLTNFGRRYWSYGL
ncbi:hypothetical protein, partial [Haemophilus parainfluenzae]|uniref:hypothetical protein n=1 Tax=Haemophilus parainfluenzae TaxID=729 RepID=UPI001788B195